MENSIHITLVLMLAIWCRIIHMPTALPVPSQPQWWVFFFALIRWRLCGTLQFIFKDSTLVYESRIQFWTFFFISLESNERKISFKAHIKSGMILVFIFFFFILLLALFYIGSCLENDFFLLISFYLFFFVIFTDWLFFLILFSHVCERLEIENCLVDCWIEWREKSTLNAAMWGAFRAMEP